MMYFLLFFFSGQRLWKEYEELQIVGGLFATISICMLPMGKNFDTSKISSCIWTTEEFECLGRLSSKQLR